MFKNERLVVWEYVSNGLEYVDPGTSPVVQVRLEQQRRRITIQDNGRGMDWLALQNFFVMHGENQDRKAGRPGRGRFGTGKAAAFGIADSLSITTVKDGRLSKVELSRAGILATASGEPVPVRAIRREEGTDKPNGTLIEIEGVHQKRLDQASVTAYIERHLAHWPRDVVVLVNNHQCEFAEPPIERELVFGAEDEDRAVLGDVVLTLKITKSPLDEDLRGVSIFSNGVWHGTTLLTSASKEMAEYILGGIDVPRLDTDTSTPSAFDASRSLQLNPGNPLVGAIYAFIGPKIEEARRALVAEQREHRETENAKRLRKQAEKIEEVINRDFDAFRKRLQKVKAAASRAGFDVGSEAAAQGAGDDEEEFLLGGDEPATKVSETGEPGSEGTGGTSRERQEPRRLNPVVEPDAEGASSGHSKPKGASEAARRQGGFSIEFDHQGEKADRALYRKDSRTIFVNLDHPQMASALRNGVDDPVFRHLGYEVAFCEYAIALASELDNRDEFLDAADAIYEIRETVNRIAVAAASLYSE